MVAKESIQKTAEQTVVARGNINTVGRARRRAMVVKEQGHNTRRRHEEWNMVLRKH